MVNSFGVYMDGDYIHQALFGRKDHGRSLYDLRNDIAHGNVSEFDFDKAEEMKHRLHQAEAISRKIILKTISSAGAYLQSKGI